MKSTLSNFLTLGLSGLNYWTAMGETATASGNVIAKRSGIIGHAMRNPFQGDANELARMMPEKIEAFARSGQSLVADMNSVRALTLAQTQDVIAVTLRGKLATMADVERIASRAFSIMNVMTNASAQALHPVHSTVTANARRLK
jgi:hypothetical protein